MLSLGNNLPNSGTWVESVLDTSEVPQLYRQDRFCISPNKVVERAQNKMKYCLNIVV